MIQISVVMNLITIVMVSMIIVNCLTTMDQNFAALSAKKGGNWDQDILYDHALEIHSIYIYDTSMETLRMMENDFAQKAHGNEDRLNHLIQQLHEADKVRKK